jgi:hypothetical protein
MRPFVIKDAMTRWIDPYGDPTACQTIASTKIASMA